MRPLKLAILSLSVVATISASSQISSQENFLCDSNNRPTYCFYGTDPVCASMTDCKEPLACQYTAGNNCTACLNTRVTSYTSGPCKEEKAPIESFCNTNSNYEGKEPSKREKRPVCAIIADCYGDNCAQPAPDGTSACLQPGTTSYISGACPNAEQPKKIVCDVENRPAACGTATQHVCAFFREGVEGPGYQTLPSPCYACLDETVEFYVPGICMADIEQNKNFCDLNSLPRPCPPPPSDFFSPACVYRRNCTEEPCRYTVGYDCVACGIGSEVDYYTPGPCMTFCDSKKLEEFCSEDSGAVCAFVRGCTGDNCSRTVESSCIACSDVEIENYYEGECRTIGFDEDLPIGIE